MFHWETIFIYLIVLQIVSILSASLLYMYGKNNGGIIKRIKPFSMLILWVIIHIMMISMVYFIMIAVMQYFEMLMLHFMQSIYPFSWLF